MFENLFCSMFYDYLKFDDNFDELMEKFDRYN